jgi:hypothetical protein
MDWCKYAPIICGVHSHHTHWCIAFPATAVVDDVAQFLGGGSSESYDRYAEIMISSPQLPPHVYLILTVVASTLMWFLT